MLRSCRSQYESSHDILHIYMANNSWRFVYITYISFIPSQFHVYDDTYQQIDLPVLIGIPVLLFGNVYHDSSTCTFVLYFGVCNGNDIH